MVANLDAKMLRFMSADEFRALVSAWVLQTNVPGGDDPQAALPQPPN